MKKIFDAIVIGSGQSGPFLAVRMAAAGKRVAIIERHRFGGNVREYRLHPNKDAGRLRLQRAYGTPGGGLWSPSGRESTR